MTDRGIRVDPHYGLVEINSKARLRNVNDVFVFAKQCQQVYYTYTPSFKNDRSRVDWLSVLKTKPRGRVELVQDENEDTNVQDEVFQVSELVEPYRVAPSIDLEESSNFRVFDDSLVDVDAEELNVVLISSGQANVNEVIISILKITMKVMTIQLTTTKKKILTNYQNEALCKTFFSCNIYYG
jgi:hypothetical protein